MRKEHDNSQQKRTPGTCPHYMPRALKATFTTTATSPSARPAPQYHPHCQTIGDRKTRARTRPSTPLTSTTTYRGNLTPNRHSNTQPKDPTRNHPRDHSPKGIAKDQAPNTHQQKDDLQHHKKAQPIKRPGNTHKGKPLTTTKSNEKGQRRHSQPTHYPLRRPHTYMHTQSPHNNQSMNHSDNERNLTSQPRIHNTLRLATQTTT